ncbi:ABC transporter substrate-binding protein [Nocardiopsis sediminis]|uniref:ABC transporter substrate-binding protein n=1 Tax=Nocardiopsis sediminis TaxID=1778267 RepID=A0ABV8FWT4_9ACTN
MPLSLPSPRHCSPLAACLSLALLTSGCAYLQGGGGQVADPDSPACAPFREWQDTGGGRVEVYASIRDTEGEAMQAAWDDFARCTGIHISYEGTGEFEAQIQVKIAGGNAPDVAFFPQPGLLARFIESGDALPLPAGAAQRAEEGWTADWLDYVRRDGELYATPLGANVKSIVWYSPGFFADNGYEIPETWDDMIALSDRMAGDGVTPWCAGIESGEATGWPVTDWLEAVVLREYGPDVYDQWVAHEIPFDDPRIAASLDRVGDILRNPDYVGEVQSILTTAQQDAGLPILDGECGMYLIGSFYASNWPEGTDISPDGDVFTFDLPEMNPDVGRPVLGGGEFAAGFSDRPEVVAFQEYLATVDYADRRAQAGAWFSAHQDSDLDALLNANDRFAAELLRDPGTVFRWDGGDNMPATVGSGTFWRGMTDWVNGDDTDDVLAYIENSWPA